MSTTAARPVISLLLFCGSIVLLVGSYYFSYKSGCLFDGKQGLGDLAASKPYTTASLMSFFAAILCLCLGCAALCHWQVRKAAYVFVLAIAIGIPIFGGISFEAAIHGTQECRPS